MGPEIGSRMRETNEKSTATTATPSPAGADGKKAARAEVAPGVWLDGRLALYHETGRWLVVSDIHYGYEISRRAAGGLFPAWGMQSIEDRLEELLTGYAPDHLIITGDVIDSHTATAEALRWLHALEDRCQGRLILVAGNHDRGRVRHEFDFVSHYTTPEGYTFHHGHEDLEVDLLPKTHAIEVAGHFHPSVSFHDGAGLRLRLPALVQEERRWILPAFSPWAGGGPWRRSKQETTRLWACSPQRVFPWEEAE